MRKIWLAGAAMLAVLPLAGRAQDETPSQICARPEVTAVLLQVLTRLEARPQTWVIRDIAVDPGSIGGRQVQPDVYLCIASAHGQPKRWNGLQWSDDLQVPKGSPGLHRDGTAWSNVKYTLEYYGDQFDLHVIQYDRDESER
jgi:hypothetical protein